MAYQAAPPPPNKPGAWTSGLFDCCDDLPICLLGYCCGCISHGMLHEEVHGEGCFLAGALWYLTCGCCLPLCLFGPKLRQSVRSKYQLPEEPCGGASTAPAATNAQAKEARTLVLPFVMRGGRASARSLLCRCTGLCASIDRLVLWVQIAACTASATPALPARSGARSRSGARDRASNCKAQQGRGRTLRPRPLHHRAWHHTIRDRFEMYPKTEMRWW